MARAMNGLRLLTLLVGCSLALLGHAQALSDPTRPALEMKADEGGEGAIAGNAASNTAGLQSIVRRNKGKPAALINGEYVELNGRVGDARLIEVGEDFVVLRGPGGKEVLRLTPGVEKVIATSPSAGRKKHPGNPSEEMKK